MSKIKEKNNINEDYIKNINNLKVQKDELLNFKTMTVD